MTAKVISNETNRAKKYDVNEKEFAIKILSEDKQIANQKIKKSIKIDIDTRVAESQENLNLKTIKMRLKNKNFF